MWWQALMQTNVYIDGFNLYYGAVRGTTLKWLDLRRVIENVFPSDKINSIHYFTAPIHPRPGNVGAPQRQQAYWRALETIPGFQLHLGAFRTREITRPLVKPIAGLPNYVTVSDYEEKRSDVNLASRLLLDGCQTKFEQAVVVTNDADFVTPLTYVRDELGLKICLLNPVVRGRTQKQLAQSVSFVKRLRPRHLRAAQLPAVVKDNRGAILKPADW